MVKPMKFRDDPVFHNTGEYEVVFSEAAGEANGHMTIDTGGKIFSGLTFTMGYFMWKNFSLRQRRKFNPQKPTAEYEWELQMDVPDSSFVFKWRRDTLPEIISIFHNLTKDEEAK